MKKYQIDIVLLPKRERWIRTIVAVSSLVFGPVLFGVWLDSLLLVFFGFLMLGLVVTGLVTNMIKESRVYSFEDARRRLAKFEEEWNNEG